MTEILKYRGSRAHYEDVAAKNDVRLGLSVEYAAHPYNDTGYIAVRFVVRHVTQIKPESSAFGEFTHFKMRDKADFATLGDHATTFKGRRLNKVLVPVFKPAPCGHTVAEVGDSLNVWTPIATWIAEQIEKEGFMLLLPDADLATWVRAQVAGEPQAPSELVLDLPDLKKSSAKKSYKASDEDDEDDDDNDDEDDVKGWVN